MVINRFNVSLLTAALFACLTGLASAADTAIVTLNANGSEWHYPKNRTQPFVCKSAESLVEGFGKEVAKRIEGKVDFKTHHVLVFRWDNSGSDNFEVKKPKKKGDPVVFKLSRGNTKASKADIRAFAVPIGLKWHYSSVNRFDERKRLAK